MPDFAATDGTRIFYSDEGDGTPVLALAGLSRNGSDFDYLAPHVPGIRLIRLDYRGRGKSEWSGAATYTIATEAGDAIALLDHLGITKSAILGTSRGGLIAMVMAAMTKERLLGVCLNDIGPVIENAGLTAIKTYIGRNPVEKTFEEAAEMRAALMKGFKHVPADRWAAEVRKHYRVTASGLAINYDPKLRDAVLAAASAPTQDAWPLFDALVGLPIALIRGENSDILSMLTAEEMLRRRPDMIRAEVPGRGHVPFLDEPEALVAIHKWLDLLP
ncbi:MAG: alpha/beta fold hydrolase [Boseongicola sp.]